MLGGMVKMGLVDYSDSDSSGTEQPEKADQTNKPKEDPRALNKNGPAFQKIVDRTQPNKIRVTLPESSRSPDHILEPGGNGVDGSPAKRARTSGGSSSFNSFLPAPKNAGREREGPNASKPGRILGGKAADKSRGPSPKTGAASAFARHSGPDEHAASDGQNFTPSAREDNSSDPAGALQNGLPALPLEENQERPGESKAVGKPVMFRPLSISRKPQKKKKQVTEISIAAATVGDGLQAANAETKANEAVSKPVPKLSLFSNPTEDIEESTGGEDAGVDASLLEPQTETQGITDIEPTPATEHTQPPQSGTNIPAGSTNLNDVANNLGLTAAQRRQLFGRNGQASEAQIAQFNLAAEYAHNRELNDNQTTAPVQNPVRSIAPGKHSLQQLVNAATNQKDALEESFAEGRRNKKDAGSKYGW